MKLLKIRIENIPVIMNSGQYWTYFIFIELCKTYRPLSGQLYSRMKVFLSSLNSVIFIFNLF